MQYKIHRSIVTFDSNNIVMARSDEFVSDAYDTEEEANKVRKNNAKEISDFLQKSHLHVKCCKVVENSFSTWLGIQFDDNTQASVKYEVVSVEG